jgi:CRP-like cAMP-binding protein
VAATQPVSSIGNALASISTDIMEPNSSKMGPFFEDALSYLPCSTITEFNKGDVIYDTTEPSHGLFLIIEGSVKVIRLAGEDEVVVHVCHADEFFGEGAFIQAAGERVAALEHTRLMSWSFDALRDLMTAHSKLGIALLQLLAKRSNELEDRVLTLSVDSTCRRLAKALLHLSERSDSRNPQDPAVRHLKPHSHKLLAQYIGTTREAVTHCMNQLRRQSLIRYSRRGIDLYADALKSWLDAGTDHKSRPLVTSESKLPG